jgi:hypothetical protein
LFTSYRHLNFVSEHVRTNYPYKSQGNMPPAKLIHWFKKTPNAVLLATSTFWQGIDMKGDMLSLVVIVKMPFGSPGDPVYDERCKRLGQRWFKDLALPSAILLLKQGFGRLIRSARDYGVVAILDPRVITSSYGKTIVSSLPEMDIVYGIDDVKSFFDFIPQPRCSNTEKDISRVVALGNSNDPSVILELIEFTKSGNGNERRLSASALGKLACFKPEIYAAVDALETLLGDKRPQVRQYALKALGEIGRVSEEKIAAVINNPEEKGYNVSLARRLIKKAEKVFT